MESQLLKSLRTPLKRPRFDRKGGRSIIIPPRPKNAVKRKYEQSGASTIFRVYFIPLKNIFSPVCRHFSSHVLKSLRTPLKRPRFDRKGGRSIIIPPRPKNAVKRKYEQSGASTIFRVYFIPLKNIFSPVCRHFSSHVLKSLRTPLKRPRFDGKGVRSIKLYPLALKTP